MHCPASFPTMNLPAVTSDWKNGGYRQTNRQPASKLTKFKYIINERIVILSFSFLCTKIEKRFHNPVHGHRLISNTVQISLLLVGRLPQKTIFVENKKEESYPMYLMYLTCLTVAYPLRNDEFCGCPRRQLLLCEQDALHLFD